MFTLDSRLQADTFLIGELPLCRALLMNDARYPWCILVPRQADIVELFELSEQDQQQLWQESALLARVMQKTFKADKMNVATLGNMVRQLHMHIIARTANDDAWPGPVWGKHASLPYTPEAADTTISRLREALQSALR